MLLGAWWRRHLVRRSGSISRESWMEVSFSSRQVSRSSMMSCRLFTSDTISYTEFCVWRVEALVRRNINY